MDIVAVYFFFESDKKKEKNASHKLDFATLRCAKHTYNTRPFENGSAGRREEGLASLTTCTKNEKNEVKSPFLIPERGAGKSALGEGEGNYPLMAKI